MCFSPEADIVGAVAVGVVGVDTIRQVRERRDWPLACVPLLFAGHFLIETFVWWGLEGQVPWSVGRSATWLYLFIALVVVPSFIPFAVMLSEPSARRRQAMAGLTMLGCSVAVVMLISLVYQPFSADVRENCIAYDTQLPDGGTLTLIYVIAACGVLLLSSSRRIFAFGLANLVVVVLLAWLMKYALISLWCAWAAVASVAINLHLRSKRHDHPTDRHRGPPVPFADDDREPLGIGAGVAPTRPNEEHRARGHRGDEHRGTDEDPG